MILVVEEFVSLVGLRERYTTMTFVEDDILHFYINLAKFICLIRDGIIQEKPILEVSTQSIRESGLLGVTSVGSSVYIYFTEYAQDETDNFRQLGNKIFTSMIGISEDLVNPVLIKDTCI